jgi:hypothetical protein
MLPLIFWAILQSSAPRPAQATPLLADCSGERNTTSCHSFNRLIERGDKTVLRNTADSSYACFRSEGDVFFLISYPQPKPADQTFNSPTVEYHLFKDGVSDDFRVAHGQWKKQADGSFNFEETKAPASQSTALDAHASITKAELSFNYAFQDSASRTTDYSVKVLRSTLRVVETYQRPRESDGARRTVTYSGYCVDYPK